MRKLTARQRQSIVMEFKEGWSMGDIAYAWSVPVLRIEAIIRAAMKRKA